MLSFGLKCIEVMPKQRMQAHQISLIIPSLEAGGAEAVMVELANGFVARGIKVHLVVLQAKGPFLSRLSSQVKVIDLNARNYLSCLIKLFRYICSEKPQALLSTIVITDLLTLLANRLSALCGAHSFVAVRVATTISKLPRLGIKRVIAQFLISHIYPWANAIIANSKGGAQDLADYAGIPRSRIHVVYNPMITPCFLAEMHESLRHPWFEPDRMHPIIIGMGRLSQEKDFSTLLKAFASVRQHLSSASFMPKLVILGEGKERLHLEELSRQLGIESHVSITGFVSNPAAYLSKSSVFVLSSLFEGLPGALIQAMACGCSLVSTDCPNGPREILDGGKYGRLVPIGNAPAMADAIIDALKKEKQKPPLEWLAQYELDVILDQYLQVMNLDSMN